MLLFLRFWSGKCEHELAFVELPRIRDGIEAGVAVRIRIEDIKEIVDIPCLFQIDSLPQCSLELGEKSSIDVDGLTKHVHDFYGVEVARSGGKQEVGDAIDNGDWLL